VSTGVDERAVSQPPASAPAHPAWRHALELGPVLTGAVFAAGAVLSMARAPAVAVVVVAFAVAAGITVAAVIMAGSGYGAAWAAAAACCAAGWTAYAAVAGPWSWPAFTGLVVPAAILTPLWPAVRAHEARVAEAERRRLAALAAAEGARKWPAHLARIGFRGVQAAGREDTLCGYKVRLRLPATGRVTYKTLAAATDKLEVAAKVRRSSLRFEQLPGQAAHEVILHVAERDVLAETIPFPLEHRRQTINDPIAVGLHEDGTACPLLLREVATLVIGLRGSGKSSLLNVLIAQLARTVDCIIFVLDLKGGRMATPWLRPWLDARTPRPVIDWVATTREEAALMLEACLRGIDARSRSGTGGEKITPSIDHPAVIVICDEAAVVLGMGTGGPKSSFENAGPTNRSLAELMKQFTILGRSEAVDPMLAAQRGTVTMLGDGDLKSQFGLRIGLGVATEADARLIIPDDVHIAANLAALHHPGSGIVQQGRHGRVLPVKFYRLEPGDITRIATATGWIRPAPDPLLAEALGRVYEERWTHRGSYLVPASPATASAVTPPGVAADEFEAIVARSLRDVDVQLPDDDTASPARKRMRSFIKRMTPPGVSVGAIVTLLTQEKMAVTRQTVHKWLNEDAAAGLVEKQGFANWRWRGGL
jgi:hypothetical protein